MISLLLVSFLILIYVIYWLNKSINIPESISSTYYLLDNMGWVFQIILFLLAFLLMPIWLLLSNPSNQFLVFITCAGILFIASAPNFKIKFEGKIHYIAACTCGAASILWQIMEGMYNNILLSIFICFVLYLKYKSWFFWVEISIILSLLISLWNKIL